MAGVSPLFCCRICGRPKDASKAGPFCSRRCAEVDLGKWLLDEYRIPTSPDEEDAPRGIRPDADEGG